MISQKLLNFVHAMHDREASAKLYNKMIELQSSYKQNEIYMTKIAYHIDKETNVARLIFTNLTGKQSFNIFSGDIDKFISEHHSLEDGSSICVYGIILKDLLEPYEIDLLQRYNDYCQKRFAKEEAKKLATIVYNVGDKVALKSKIRDGSKKIIKKFIVKRIIWSVNLNPVNILILKQIEGPINNLSLTKADCKKYHIKYEENLQVYSMFMNFTKLN